jgi:transposase
MEERRWVGIDVGKRTMEVRIIDGHSKVLAWNGKTDGKGRTRLAELVRPNDLVGIEAGILGFAIAKDLRRFGTEVLILNPGMLAVIYATTKKTDAEDALKLARLVQRFSPDELPVVNAPTEEEEQDRELVSELIFLKESRTRFVNHLHAIYLRAGQTMVTKRDLATQVSRKDTHLKLIGRYDREATRCERLIDEIEVQIAQIEQAQTERLKKNELTPHLFSVPGVGPALAMAFEAYIGDGSRFHSGAQVANYTGLVPRVDCSGDCRRYGPITKRGCVAIRRVAIQSAWAMVSSRDGGDFKTFYERRSTELGKKKAIVAIARKMVVLMYTLVKNKDFYRNTPLKDRLLKLRRYRVAAIGGLGVDAIT